MIRYASFRRGIIETPFRNRAGKSFPAQCRRCYWFCAGAVRHRSARKQAKVDRPLRCWQLVPTVRAVSRLYPSGSCRLRSLRGGLVFSVDPEKAYRSNMSRECFQLVATVKPPSVAATTRFCCCWRDWGVRAGEVVSLGLEDIDWEAQDISPCESKGDRSAQLPLPADVGKAIAAYLKNGRPRSKSRCVFLR